MRSNQAGMMLTAMQRSQSHRRCLRVLLVLLSGVTAWQPALADRLGKSWPEQRMILGYVERVWFQAGEISVKAKLDTGAKTSSLDARNIELFERKGKRWVRFEFWTRDEEKPYVTLEKRVKRFVLIKRHKTKHQRRAVVEMSFCVGGKPGRGEFNLIDRQKFIYPVLLGRQVLKSRALVDSGASFLGGYECAPDAERKV